MLSEFVSSLQFSFQKSTNFELVQAVPMANVQKLADYLEEFAQRKQ